jgi:hypothetical protein
MDNHFLPRFYLSRWAVNGRLIEYRYRKKGQIGGKPIGPKGTGFRPNLYKNRQKQGIEAHIFEIDFLKKHDDLAARALKKIEKGLQGSDEEVCGWISFLMALQLRHPSDIEVLRLAYEQKWKSEMSSVLQPQFSLVWGQDNPNDVNVFIEQQWPGIMEESMFGLLAKLMEHEDIGQMILDFDHTVTTLNSDIPLITSDRPMLMTATLAEEDAYIIMPIGPKKVYVAGKTKNTVQRILNKTGDEFAQIINHQVASHAEIAVYSAYQGLDEYVGERLGQKTYDSVFTRLSRGWNHDFS